MVVNVNLYFNVTCNMCSPRVGGQDVPLQLVPLRGRGVVLLQLRVQVVIAHIISDPDKF